jgi:uncharacterized membrane protein (DUF485 family)
MESSLLILIGPLQLEVMLSQAMLSSYTFFVKFHVFKKHISFPLRQETLKLGINTNFKVLFLIMSIILSSELIFRHVLPRDL